MNHNVKITEENGNYTARVPGILAAGSGPNAESAGLHLASVLGEMVNGHKGSMGHLRTQLRKLADPTFQDGDTVCEQLGYYPEHG